MNFNLYFYLFVFYYWVLFNLQNFWSWIFNCKAPWAYRYGTIEILTIIYLFITIIIIINLYTTCGLFTHKLTVKYLGLVLSGFCFCSCHLLFFFSQSNLNCNRCKTFCLHHQLFVSFLRLKYLYALFQASWKVYQNKGGRGGVIFYRDCVAAMLEGTAR